ncbi:DoxX family protein [Flavobacteriales bacterium]|nr:DoxX family protein [Flavobacteriales bacterium]
MSLLYVIVGVKHFTNTDFFVTIVPSIINCKEEVVLVSGMIEVLLGILLLFNQTRKLAAWGIILLLIAVFPANIYLYLSEIARQTLSISKTQALYRLPFQIPLMIISYWHSKEIHSKQLSIICSGLFIPTIIYFITI